MIQCRLNVGPPSTTLGKHWTNIWLMLFVCCHRWSKWGVKSSKKAGRIQNLKGGGPIKTTWGTTPVNVECQSPIFCQFWTMLTQFSFGLFWPPLDPPLQTTSIENCSWHSSCDSSSAEAPCKYHAYRASGLRLASWKKWIIWAWGDLRVNTRKLCNRRRSVIGMRWNCSLDTLF